MRGARVWLPAVAVMIAACGGDDGTPTETAVFTTLSVEPASPTVVVGFTLPLSVTARSQSNAVMPGLTATYTSSDQTKATVTTSGVVNGVALGTSRITVTGTIGSVTKTQEVTVTVGAAPLTAAVSASASQTFIPNVTVVARTGTVTWNFAILHNVTFDGTTGPANIPDTGNGNVSRPFPNAGTFTYRCTIHPGMNGSVTVVP